MEKRVIYFGIAWIVLVIAFIAVFFFARPEMCGDIACFNNNMRSCSSAVFVNEQPEASWKYEVVGSVEGECRVDVTLLMAKEGDLELRGYEGNSMSCYFPLGDTGLPDEDLELCTGELKENLQSRIIEKLHEYLLDNLDDVVAELG